MDVMNMKDIADNEYNVALDKATLDSILCGENSESNCEKMLQEVNRILKPNGVFICISYGNEEQRKDYLKNKLINFWDLKVEKVMKPSLSLSGSINDEKDPKNFHYIYIMTKLV
jgi:ubiquinone/menaquinone biosynthesis C-methylase UbiE